jgi:hypothetical protein
MSELRCGTCGQLDYDELMVQHTAQLQHEYHAGWETCMKTNHGSIYKCGKDLTELDAKLAELQSKYEKAVRFLEALSYFSDATREYKSLSIEWAHNAKGLLADLGAIGAIAE